MKALIIGATGQLGSALAAAFADGYDVIRTTHRQAAPGHVAFDLGDADAARRQLRDTAPGLVLLAGAMCHVDGCELDPDACRRVNVDGTQTVAEYVRDSGAFLVTYSSDHVFDGSRESFAEQDAVNPLNVYARSKVLGEAIVRELIPDQHLILRTGWVYGPDRQRRNFMLRLLDRVAAGERVTVPADQWGSPTCTLDLAAATRFLIEAGHRGTFHATGPDYVDRPTLARAACAAFGLATDGVLAAATSELNQAAPRPLRVRLDCRKLQATGAAPFRNIRDGLRVLGAAGVVGAGLQVQTP